MFLPIGGNPLCILGSLYVYVLIARAILSWFPLRSDSPFVTVSRFLQLVTEPVLAPFRRIIPPVGMFDVSFLVAIISVEIVTSLVLCRL
jgi:YggT family protein